MLVKICGIKNIEAAITAEKEGADFIGFVFAPSKRRVSPVQAAEIAKNISPTIKKVGVFVNESIENIHHIAKLVGLDYVQLHGDESTVFAKKISYPIIKAISIEKAKKQDIRNYPCDYLLIDSPGKKYRGGSGTVFNWDELHNVNVDKKKVILAGGLSHENVEQAIAAVLPAGVDVSSGVESGGEKDHHKIKQFLNKAKDTKSIRKVDIK